MKKMNIIDLALQAEKPKLYERGTAFMWTDKHISNQLLNIHLDPEVDLASRKRSSIERTAQWILNTQKGKSKLNILDLGCGPGLYAELFAKAGHNVTGIDISETSIRYAEKSAAEKDLYITYLNRSYLEAELGSEKYDLVVLIFTDLGVLLPVERDKLLQRVFHALKKGGTFIFDVLSDKHIEQKTTPKNWEATKKGFWRDLPYLALSESFLYPEEKVILYQHIVMDEEGNNKIYRFWTHFFSQTDIQKMLQPFHFKDLTYRDDILPDGDYWSGDHVIFTRASK